MVAQDEGASAPAPELPVEAPEVEGPASDAPAPQMPAPAPQAPTPMPTFPPVPPAAPAPVAIAPVTEPTSDTPAPDTNPQDPALSAASGRLVAEGEAPVEATPAAPEVSPAPAARPAAEPVIAEAVPAPAPGPARTEAPQAPVPAAPARAAEPAPPPVLAHRAPQIHALLQLTQNVGGEAVARLALHPEELGHVEVVLRAGAEGLTATITADSSLAVAVLDRAAGELRNTLEAGGVHLAQIEVAGRDDAAPRDRDGQPGSPHGRRATHLDLEPDPDPDAQDVVVALATGVLVDVRA